MDVAGGKSLQQVRVDEDPFGLVEGAGQVFPAGQVHCHLAAYGAVDLGQYGGGNLEEGNPPHVGGCRKAAQIAGYAAGEGDQGVTPGHTKLRQGVIHVGEDFQILAGLAGGNGNDPYLKAGLPQHLPYLRIG